MSHRILVSATAAALLTSLAGSAAAQTPTRPAQQATDAEAVPPAYTRVAVPEPEPGTHTHDGFFFRVYLGPAYTHLTSDAVTIKGGGGAFGLAVGTAVSERVVVYGELFDDVATGPEFNGAVEGQAKDEVVAGMIGFGAGATYYTPENVFFSLSLAATRVTVQEDYEEIGRSDYGLGATAMMGKEWWVSPQWALGVAGQAAFASMKDGDDRFKGTAFGLVVTATCN